MKKVNSLLNHFVIQSNNNIKIGDDDYLFNTNGNDRQDVIDGLKKLNVFVGANNSGKSRILRTVFDQNFLMDLRLTSDFFIFIKKIKGIMEKSRIAKGQLPKTSQYIETVDRFPKNHFFTFTDDFLNKTNELKNEIDRILKEPGVFPVNGEPMIPTELAQIMTDHEDLLVSINTPSNRHRSIK